MQMKMGIIKAALIAMVLLVLGGCGGGDSGGGVFLVPNDTNTNANTNTYTISGTITGQVSTARSKLRLELIDIMSAGANSFPLRNNPYTGFRFLLNGNMIEVSSPAIMAARTYSDLQTAISGAVNANPALAGFTVSLGANFTAYSFVTGQPLTGIEIVVDNNNIGVISLDDINVGFFQGANVPADSQFHTSMSVETTNSGTTTTGIPGVSVTLSDGINQKTVSTTTNGTYSFTLLVNGTYSVTPNRFGSVPLTRTVTVNGANMTGNNFTIN